TVEWSDGTMARRYAFTHQLYLQVVYEQIPEARRAPLHRRVGAAPQTHGTRANGIAPQLATHFQRAGDPARALRYLTAAGLRARRRFASRDAIANLEGALAWAPLLPDADGRRRREAQVSLALARRRARLRC